MVNASAPIHREPIVHASKSSHMAPIVISPSLPTPQPSRMRMKGRFSTRSSQSIRNMVRLLLMRGTSQGNVSVNSKPDHPPSQTIPGDSLVFIAPGVGFSPNFLCPAGRGFQLEKFPTVLKEKCRNFTICFKETGAV